MATTNFASLTDEQKTVWSRELWENAQDRAFISKFVGTGSDAIIQRVTDLTRTEKGEKVIMHLLADLVSDGISGDDDREGTEEAMQSYTDTITIDLISNGVREKGKLAAQKTVVSFRENARDRLSYWLANRIDQLAFLTLSGISYDKNLDGSDRTSTTFSELAFAADVSAPTANRHFRVTNSSGVSSGYTGIVAGDTSLVADTDVLSYSAIVDITTLAKTNHIKPVIEGGKEYYVAYVRPEALAQLKKDPDYQRAVVTGLERSSSNPFFTGGTVTVDGLVIHEYHMVYNTKGAAAGNKWGAGGNVDGSRMLICGSQALGFADLSEPEWSEKYFNYDSSPGVNIDKMFGFLKPKFKNIYTDTVEDFGLFVIDHAV